MATYHCSLAQKYNPDKHDVIGWVYSEKLDGVRALWCPDRKGFFSRSDKPLNVPPSWQAAFADVKVRLDGEFFMGRGNFQACVSAVRKKEPTEEQFENVIYVVFDTISDGDHRTRLGLADYALASNEALEDKAITLPHFPIEDLETVHASYALTLQAGGEGLMFRNPKAGYEKKRTGNLLKWKDMIDGTATVIGMDEGTGKHKGRMGALVCNDDETSVSFRVGTGFSDEERQDWWDLQEDSNRITSIRWRAMERTKDNVPRHPVYVCIHKGD